MGGTWPEGQSSCSAWPFVQGIIERSKLRGVMKRPGLRQTAVGNPRFEREVKFVPYFNLGDRKTVDNPGDRKTVDNPGDRKTVGTIGDDRTVFAERHAVRCANLP